MNTFFQIDRLLGGPSTQKFTNIIKFLLFILKTKYINSDIFQWKFHISIM